jgi:hypothetical protein
MHIRTALLLALIALPACTGLPSTASREILDEQTGNTLFVAGRPLVFARTRTDVAANARDYATLVAIEVDHSGKYSDYLLLYRWSTVDRRMSAPPEPQQGELRILADGRDIDLTPLAEMPISLARGRELHVPPHGDVVAHAYPTDATMLRYLAMSGELILRMPQERLDTPFAIFEDGRSSLRQFLKKTGS